MLRRPNRDKKNSDSTNEGTYIVGRWQLQTSTRELKELGGEPVLLTSGEFDLLQTLVQNPGRILTRDQLMDALHGIDTPAYERSIDVRIGRLRKKIEDDPNRPKVIKTIRNAGYMFAYKVSTDRTSIFRLYSRQEIHIRSTMAISIHIESLMPHQLYANLKF